MNTKTIKTIPVVPSTPADIDLRRRNFLKFAIFGSLAFLAGRYLQPLINTIRGEAVIDEKVFQNFKLTETGKQLRITDEDNEELLVIDKEGF